MEDVPNEILRTPDWLVDHRGGRLRRLHARFGGALCGVPMRRDAYAGMCWLIDGAEVPLSAVRRRLQTLRRPRACRFPTRWTKRDGWTALCRQAVPPRRASLRLGFDTFLAQSRCKR